MTTTGCLCKRIGTLHGAPLWDATGCPLIHDNDAYLDNITALDREDVEAVIECLRARAERIGIREITPLQFALARFADALEHLIDRKD